MTASAISVLSKTAKNLTTLDELFNQEYREAPIKFDIDPLVLSVRLKKENEAAPTWGRRIEDPEVKSKLTGDDWNDAAKIRDYYSKKIMWHSLKDSRTSDYRAHLLSFLEHPKATLTRKEVGMVVTLPYFYEEDQVHDHLVKQYCTINIPNVRSNMKSILRELTYVQQTKRWVNKKKFIYYWFTDDNQFVYNIQLTEDNVLRKFFEDIVLTRKTAVFETYINKVEHPFGYYKMFDYRLVK